MDPSQKMIDLFNAVADAAIERVKKEKETNLSEETFRMISLTQSLHNSIKCYSTNKNSGVNPFSLH